MGWFSLLHHFGFVQAYLKADNAGSHDMFGRSVAVDGDTVVVGAYQDDSNQRTITAAGSDDNSASGAGAAYVFVRSNGATWTQQARTALLGSLALVTCAHGLPSACPVYPHGMLHFSAPFGICTARRHLLGCPHTVPPVSNVCQAYLKADNADASDWRREN